MNHNRLGARSRRPKRCCPSCNRLLSAQQVCWSCCDRPCRVCGKTTGSAFVDICWPCWFQTEYGAAPVTGSFSAEPKATHSAGAAR